MSCARRFTIVNNRGLHARASARFVETVERFSAAVTVSREGQRVSGDSIMGLLMLAAAKDCTIDVTAEGAEADAVLDALENLIANRFGEEI